MSPNDAATRAVTQTRSSLQLGRAALIALWVTQVVLALAFLMAIGSAGSLQQALQHATTELHHWLDDDFGFSERSLSIFLGQAIEYEVAHVGDQNVTVVAKVRRSYMPREAK